MCEPISMSTALPAALAIGGAVANTAYQYQVADEQEQATAQANQMSMAAQAAERQRQTQFNQEALANWDQTREQLTPEAHETSRTHATARMLSQLDNMGSGEGPGLVSSQPRASEEVRNVIARQTSNQAAKSRQQIEAAARLSAYGSAAQDRGTALGENADLLSMLAGLRSGSLGVSSVEQQVPRARVSANPWVTGAIGAAQAAGQVGLNQAGYSAGYGG